ncbi:MAG: hypothetical protein WBP85_03430 [Terracidiphilus sp.]
MLERMRLACAALLLFTAIGGAEAAQPPAQTHQRQFQFEQFPAEVYKGPIRIPTGLHKDENGEWQDALGNSVAPPEVGFAGEYYLPVHSCGTGCRYYDLISLRTGKTIPEISMFGTGDPMPKTRDGHPYLTILYYKPDSRLLIAEYHLDFDELNKQETCRQRYFVLADGKIKPISKTFSFCTEQH